MRICQLSHVERTYSFLAPLFHALDAEGHEVVAACNLEHGGAEARRFLGPGFRLDRIHVSRRITIAALTTEILDLAGYLRRGRFDVLHVHSPLASLQARAAAGLARVPVVVCQAHGFYFHDGTRALPRATMIAIERTFGRHLTDYLVTVNAEDTALARRLGFRPDPADVVHIPGVGIDTARFAPPPGPAGAAARRALRRDLGAGDADLVVTFVGRLVREKGVVELAQAFSRLSIPTARLWLVGDVMASERDQDTIERIHAALAPSAAVRTALLGRRLDVPDLLRASDVFVLPSYREGLPVGLLEAMAVGLPVITTDVRGAREAVGGGQAGVVVPARDPDALAEALGRLAADPHARERLGRAARERVASRFTVAHSLAPQLELYRRIETSIASGAGARRDARR